MPEPTKVHLFLTLSTTPSTLSIHDAHPSTPLKLIYSLRQTSSPFPSRPITLLVKYSCLDGHDAFFRQEMHSPKNQSTPPNQVNLRSIPAPELPMRPVWKRVNIQRTSGDPDLLRRKSYSFVTVPPVGQGSVELRCEFEPEKLVGRLAQEGETVEETMRRVLRPGDVYKIAPSNLWIMWWAFGALHGDDGFKAQGKKIARWTLPDDVPLEREPGEDETEEVAKGLRDLVDRHNVNSLSSASAYEGEERPDIGKMRAEGWVFGEPEGGLEMELGGEGAFFTITE